MDAGKPQHHVTMPVRVHVDGREWRLYDFKFHAIGDDKWFCFNLYALSFEHAAALLEELKATATLMGEVDSVISAGPGN